ncbi:MAG: hypothetical protein QM811_22775 [Pirellulales bacterium]
MSSTPLRFLFVLHDHQPIGNFDNVFESAYHASYKPFLDLLDRHPHIRVGLHTSGPLMEWLDRASSRVPRSLGRLRDQRPRRDRRRRVL